MSGVQYLDELFAAIRDTAEHLARADSWLSRAEKSSPAHWQTSFLQAAQLAHRAARIKLEEATEQLFALGRPDRLPSLLSHLPERLEELQQRLETSEKRLSAACDATLEKPRGQA